MNLVISILTSLSRVKKLSDVCTDQCSGGNKQHYEQTNGAGQQDPPEGSIDELMYEFQSIRLYLLRLP